MALLSGTELDGLKDALPLWSQQPGSLVRIFRFADFSAAWGFMARVALLAETQGHHPDWSNSYGTVTIRLTTHDAGGLTDQDVRLAASIDRVLSS